MKAFFIVAGAPALLLVAGAASSKSAALAPPQATANPVQLAAKFQTNRLGNGGFESWGLGDQGSIAPELWYANGDPCSLYTQGFLNITKVTASSVPGTSPVKPSGEFVARASAGAPGDFLSQALENAAEYRGRTVTFSINAMAEFSVAVPKLIVDDGVIPSEVVRTLTLQTWERITIVHKVALGATKLEFKVEPNQTVLLDDAQVSMGALPDAAFVPRPNPEPALTEVPLGAVLDWYRFDPSVPVPEGFAIADGSVIADPQSPFCGRNTPNLVDRFARGVGSVSAIGTTGGADSASVDHNHPIPHTHSGNVILNGLWWFVPPNDGPYQCPQQWSSENFTTGGPSNASSGPSSLGSLPLTSVPTVPAYVGLLKIVRIK